MIFWLKNPLEDDSGTDSLLGVILYVEPTSFTMKSQTFAVGTLKYLLSHPDISLPEFAEDFKSLTEKLGKYGVVNTEANWTNSMMKNVNQYWKNHIPEVRKIITPFVEKYNLKLEEQYE